MSYKILSLDGGGSWAMIQARVLLDLYGDVKGHHLLQQFDMVIANSGGSLVLAALCNNLKLSEVISVFRNQQKREMIFSELTFEEKLERKNLLSFVREWVRVGPAYRAQRKRSGLIDVLRAYDDPSRPADDPGLIVNTPMHLLPALIGKESLQLIIVGYDYYKERVTFFRSNTASNTDKFSKHYGVTLGHAIHASSNAPLNYFDAPAEVDTFLYGSEQKETRKAWYWDGAVSGFNNPVLAGLIEAMTNHAGRPLSDYKILSIGTGLSRKAVLTDYKESSNPEHREIYELNLENPLVICGSSDGFMEDVGKMAQSILSDPPDSATFMAYAILDPALTGKASLVRINPCLTPEINARNIYDVPAVYSYSDEEKVKFLQLMELEMDAVQNEEVELIHDLCNRFITDEEICVPNQLIRGNDNSGAPYLGYSKYREAKQKWLELEKRLTTENAENAEATQ